MKAYLIELAFEGVALGFTFPWKLFWKKISLATETVSFHGVCSSEVEKDTLVVTDINDTLLTCTKPLWKKETPKLFSPSLKGKYSSLTQAQKNLLANLILQKSPNRLVEGACGFFSSLQEKGIPTLALTAAFAEPLDGVDMSHLVREELKDLGFFFSGLLSGERVFSNLDKDKISGGHPTLIKEGALLLNGTAHTKGEALKAYLLSVSEKKRPKNVLFFDDSEAHLESVKRELEPLGFLVKVVEAQEFSSGLESLTSREEKMWETLVDRCGLVS